MEKSCDKSSSATLGDRPNAETIAAMAEYAEMKAHPEKYKRYASFEEALEENLK